MLNVKKISTNQSVVYKLASKDIFDWPQKNVKVQIQNKVKQKLTFCRFCPSNLLSAKWKFLAFADRSVLSTQLLVLGQFQIKVCCT
jgi:hypothetical protein